MKIESIKRNILIVVLIKATLCQNYWHWVNPIPTANHLYSICNNSKIYVAVGDRGCIITSFDGESWQLQEPVNFNKLNDITRYFQLADPTDFGWPRINQWVRWNRNDLFHPTANGHRKVWPAINIDHFTRKYTFRGWWIKVGLD